MPNKISSARPKEKKFLYLSGLKLLSKKDAFQNRYKASKKRRRTQLPV